MKKGTKSKNANGRLSPIVDIRESLYPKKPAEQEKFDSVKKLFKMGKGRKNDR